MAQVAKLKKRHRMEIVKLSPHPYSAKIMFDLSEEERTALKRDIKKNGIKKPLDIASDGDILDGHHRFGIAEELGFDRVPVNVLEEIETEEDKREWIIKANLLRRQLSTDQKYLLYDELSKNYEKGQGYRTDLNEPESNVDSGKNPSVLEKTAEETGVSPSTVKRARKYRRITEKHPDLEGKSPISAINEAKRREEANKRKEKLKNAPEFKNLFLGDCLEKVSQIPDKSIHCVVSDPPYGIGWETGARENTKKMRGGDWGYDGDDATIFPLLEELFQKLEPKLKEDAHLYLFTSWKVWHKLYPVVDEFYEPSGWLGYLHYLATGGHFHGYRGGLSSILFAVNGEGRRIDGDGWNFFDVSGERRKEQDHHPAQKSLGICKKLIKNSTVQGETILDPFCGSGSTLVAAEELDRDWIGIEKEDRWFEVAKSRILEVRKDED